MRTFSKRRLEEEPIVSQRSDFLLVGYINLARSEVKKVSHYLAVAEESRFNFTNHRKLIASLKTVTRS